jgi:glutamine cyclotransferase
MVRTFISGIVLVAQQGCEHRHSVLTNLFVSDFSMLWPNSERKTAHADVLNGISVSEDPDVLYVTGKLWNRIFKLRLL